jgi:hypothetical protein
VWSDSWNGSRRHRDGPRTRRDRHTHECDAHAGKQPIARRHEDAQKESRPKNSGPSDSGPCRRCIEQEIDPT